MAEFQFVQCSSAKEEACQLSCGVVLEACGHSEFFEFMRVGLFEDAVSSQRGPDELGDDAFVGESDDHPVAGRVLLVLVLFDEPEPFPEVRFTFESPPSRDLFSRKL